MTLRIFMSVLAAFGATVAPSAVAQQNTNAEITDADLVKLLGQIRNEVDNLRKELRQFDGAVVAFDRAQTGDQLCPDGWSLFKPAQGRTMVGAGIHDNTDVDGELLSRYASHADDTSGEESASTGGKEDVTLTLPQLASHSHSVSTSYNINAHDGLAGGTATQGIDLNFNNPPSGANTDSGHGVLTTVLSVAGADVPHENMSPYVAMYFCRRN